MTTSRSSDAPVLVTGGCGFVGSSLIWSLLESGVGAADVVALDNLWRSGSETNREPLRRAGVRVVHGDVRAPTDVDALADVDWVIDAAANASVLAGVDGKTSSRQLVDHNLVGTVNLLELCRARGAGIVVLPALLIALERRGAARQS